MNPWYELEYLFYIIMEVKDKPTHWLELNLANIKIESLEKKVKRLEKDKRDLYELIESYVISAKENIDSLVQYSEKQKDMRVF